MMSYSNSPMVITIVLMKETPAFRKGETLTARVVSSSYSAWIETSTLMLKLRATIPSIYIAYIYTVTKETMFSQANIYHLFAHGFLGIGIYYIASIVTVDIELRYTASKLHAYNACVDTRCMTLVRDELTALYRIM